MFFCHFTLTICVSQANRFCANQRKMTVTEQKQKLPEGKYTYVGVDVDATGRRILDEVSEKEKHVAINLKCTEKKKKKKNQPLIGHFFALIAQTSSLPNIFIYFFFYFSVYFFLLLLHKLRLSI